MGRVQGDEAQAAAATAARECYDAVGETFLAVYGPHIHVGLYDGQDGGAGTPSWGAAQTRTVDALLDMAGMTSMEGKLLDIGCGHGATACYLAERLGCGAVGVNISPFQVHYANALAARRGLGGRASFMVADGMAPPFGDGEFNAVVSVESSSYMTDKTRFISEISRLLAPGGRLLFTDFCRTHGDLTPAQLATLGGIDKTFGSAGNWHSSETFKELLEANGLEVVAQEDWTDSVRGFWELGTAELLLRRGPDDEAAFLRRSLLGNAGVYLRGVLKFLWLAISPCFKGNPEPFVKATLGFGLGQTARVMRRAFGSGALQYRAIVAVKPPASPMPAPSSTSSLAVPDAFVAFADDCDSPAGKPAAARRKPAARAGQSDARPSLCDQQPPVVAAS